MYDQTHKSIRSFSLDMCKKKIKSCMNLSCLKKNIIYFPLVLEIYYILFHVLVVRVWMLLNFILTLMYMYNKLCQGGNHHSLSHLNDMIPDKCSDDKKCDRDAENIHTQVPIHYIKKIACVSIISGMGLLVFYSNHIGPFALPLIIHLINRTSKNIFNIGC